MQFKKKDLLSNDRLFGIEYIKKEGYNSMASHHYHDHYEIYYQISGERYYFIKDRTYHIKKGDIILIPPHDLHSTTDANPPQYERFLVNFKKDFLLGFIHAIEDVDLLYSFHRDIVVICIDEEIQETVFGLLNQLDIESRQNLIGYETRQKLLLLELLLLITRNVLIQKKHNHEFPNAVHEKISQIVQFINENYNQKLTLAEISERFYISRYHFCRQFKNVTGFSFVEYLNHVRIKQAIKLLKDNKLTVREIADQTGFESINHFSRVFKAITGTSARKYRKKA